MNMKAGPAKAELKRKIKNNNSEAMVEIKGREKLVFYGLILLIAFVSIAVYFNALSNDFIYDDERQVLANQWIKDARNIPDIFLKNVWGFQKWASNYYRPMMHIIYMFSYHLFGLNAWGFHLVNLLFNTGVSILVFLITWGVLNEYRPLPSATSLFPAFIASLLFATHPVHTEAVVWIAAVPELSFTFFCLLSLYLHIKWTDGWKPGHLLSVLFFFLGALSKETALVLPGIIIAYDFSFKKTSREIPGLLKRYLPYAAVAAVYLGLRFHALSSFAPIKQHPEMNAYQYIINIFPLFFYYLEKLVLPFNLTAIHVLHPISSIIEPKGIGSLAVTTAFAALMWAAWNKNRAAFFGMLALLLPLIPALYIPGVGKYTFAERYLYMPSAGAAILASIILQRLKIQGKNALLAAFAVLIALYSAGTINRNSVWHDSYSFWTDTVNKSPDCPDAHNNLGSAYFMKGWTDKAVNEYQMAASLDPRSSDAHYNLGDIYFLKGWTDKAIEEYQTIINIEPSAEAYNTLANMYQGKGELGRAEEYRRKANELAGN